MGKNTKLFGGGFHHVAIRVNDFDRSMKFYTEGLGFTVARAWGGAGKNRAVMLDTGDGNYFELFERDPADVPSEAVYLHAAIRTSDCDKAIQVAREAGAEVTVEPKDVEIQSSPPYPVRIAFFKGPDGEIIELFQER